MNTDLDKIDLALLDLLQAGGNLTHAELGQRVNLSAPATHARVRRLHQQGLIRNNVALLDHQRLGLDLICFVQISLRLHSAELVEEFRRQVSNVPDVLECHHITGEFDYLLKVIVANRHALEHLMVNVLTPLPGVERICTSLVLSEVKHSHVLPLAHLRSRG
ncbi:MAG: Lrp/AsnC family transcriptional regulator [Xanthomonadaceae bacterium]|nr:Lrp/AsnC family transcriptional regulator [Xanthomonadaceae bacterium]